METGKTTRLARMLRNELLTVRADRSSTLVDAAGETLLSTASQPRRAAIVGENGSSNTRPASPIQARRRETTASATVTLSATALAASRSALRDSTPAVLAESAAPTARPQEPRSTGEGVAALYASSGLDSARPGTTALQTGVRSTGPGELQDPTSAGGPAQPVPRTDVQMPHVVLFSELSARAAAQPEFVKAEPVASRGPVAELITPFLVRQTSTTTRGSYLTRPVVAAVLVGVLLLLVLYRGI